MKTKYRPDFPERVEYMLKWKGLTNEQAAKELGISKNTFYKYLDRYDDFHDAVKRGNEGIIKQLENALFKRAVGYEYSEKTLEIKDLITGQTTHKKTVKKELPPSETAAIFLLTNKLNERYKRNPDLYQEDNSLQSVDFKYINVNEYSIIPEIELLRHQLKFTKTKHKFPALVGGYGSGKSQAVVCRALELLKERKGKGIVVIGSPTYRLLSDINIPKFVEFLDKYKVPYKSSKGEMKFRLNGQIKGEIWFRSMEDVNKWIGWESSDIILDEFDTLNPDKQKELWMSSIQRNRHKCPGRENTIGIATTPEGFRYTYELVQKGIVEHIKARTDDNIFLPDSYIENFLSQFDDVRLKQAREGEFVNLNGRAAYYSFKRDRYITADNIESRFPDILHGGMDFNVDPMTAVLGYSQDKNIYYGKEYYLHNSNTYQMADLIRYDFPDKRITIRPDSTGSSRKTSAAGGVTDHSILKEYGFDITMRGNPPERDRLNLINWAFNKNKIIIDEKLKFLIRDLEQVTVNEAGCIDKKDTSLTHISDAMGYDVFWEYFSEYFGYKDTVR